MFGRSKARPARSVPLVQVPSGAPAVALEKVGAAGHVDLVKRAQKAGLSLSRRGLGGIRAQAVLVLDHSGSMYGDYRSGAVQTLVERALGFALQIDVDGTVPVIAFDSKVRPAVAVDVDTYPDVVNRELWQRKKMRGTNLAAALTEVQALAEKTDAPLFALVVTDGEPDDKQAATQVVCELARYPVFVKLLAIRPVDYLQDLDDLDPSKRLLDNVDAKFLAAHAGMSDLEFAEAMVDEWDTWVAAAVEAGVLTR